MNIKKGDGLVLWNGSRGIATTKPFKPQSMGVDGLVLAVAFEREGYTLEMPIELRSVVEVWRDGRKLDSEQETLQQMELF